MSVDCFCDRCMGYGPRCFEGGEHNYGASPTNANCRDCGEVNGPLLSYIGRVMKYAKRNGLTYAQAKHALELRQAATGLVSGRLSERVLWAP